MNTKTIIIPFMFVVLSLTSCFGPKFWGDVDLGDNYILWRDGHYCSVDYVCKTRNSKNNIPLVLENVFQYAYNDSFIVAKTVHYQEPDICSINYWIILKSDSIMTLSCSRADFNEVDSILKKQIIGPIDSVKFHEEIQNYNFSFQFQKVNNH